MKFSLLQISSARIQKEESWAGHAYDTPETQRWPEADLGAFPRVDRTYEQR